MNKQENSIMILNKNDVISHEKMCTIESINGRRGMYFRPTLCHSVLLISNPLYNDDEMTDTFIYEGHNQVRKDEDPTQIDQTKINKDGTPNENGKFYNITMNYKIGGDPEIVRIYKRINTNNWEYKGLYKLTDVYTENVIRKVYKFKLELIG